MTCIFIAAYDFDNQLASTILHEERRVLVQRLNWERSTRRLGFESLAVAQFTRRGGRPLQRLLAETNSLF